MILILTINLYRLLKVKTSDTKIIFFLTQNDEIKLNLNLNIYLRYFKES